MFVETWPVALYFKVFITFAVYLSNKTIAWLFTNPAAIIFGLCSTNDIVVGISYSENLWEF